jgi:hypothetical protein
MRATANPTTATIDAITQIITSLNPLSNFISRSFISLFVAKSPILISVAIRSFISKRNFSSAEESSFV